MNYEVRKLRAYEQMKVFLKSKMESPKWKVNEMLKS
jgi:hypothetical protein